MSLQLTDITLTYPDGDARLTALDRVSLDVPKGSLTAVVGPSGSGKSSLLAVAATLITPDSGVVTLDGSATTGMSRGNWQSCVATRSALSSSSPICCPPSPRPSNFR